MCKKFHLNIKYFYVRKYPIINSFPPGDCGFPPAHHGAVLRVVANPGVVVRSGSVL